MSEKEVKIWAICSGGPDEKLGGAFFIKCNTEGAKKYIFEIAQEDRSAYVLEGKAKNWLNHPRVESLEQGGKHLRIEVEYPGFTRYYTATEIVSGKVFDMTEHFN